MVLHIPVTPETESLLRERAAATGQDLTSYAARLLDDAVQASPGGGNGATTPEKRTPEERAAAWLAWAAAILTPSRTTAATASTRTAASENLR